MADTQTAGDRVPQLEAELASVKKLLEAAEEEIATLQKARKPQKAPKEGDLRVLDPALPHIRGGETGLWGFTFERGMIDREAWHATTIRGDVGAGVNAALRPDLLAKLPDFDKALAIRVTVEIARVEA